MISESFAPNCLKMMKAWISAFLLCTCVYGMPNPIQEWGKFPQQHLVTKNQPSVPNNSESFHYEDIIAFALKATVAAFHVDPKTFIEDQQRLEDYFEPHALNQLQQSLFAATGTGLLDNCIITQTHCDAITYAPILIEKQARHHMQVRLPMVTQDNTHIDVILQINITNKLRVSDFSIEEPYDPS